MDSDLFDNVNPVHMSAESSSNDDFLQGAQGSPFRPFMENIYPGDGMNQDDTMSGAMPPSTATATQQPTMSGALPDDASQAPAQDKDVARDLSPSIAMPSAPAPASEPVRETIATTDDTPSIDTTHAPPSPAGHATANSTTTVEDDSPFDEAAPTAVAGGREASINLGDDQSCVRTQESTEITETEINGQSVVVESHTEVIEETHKEEKTASAPPEPMSIEKHVETVVETPVPAADIDPETRGALRMDTVWDVAGSPPADTIELEIPEPPSPDSGSDAPIPAGTPQQQHQEPILGSMSVPPKRGAAGTSTDSGAKRRRRTAADMLADASSAFVSSDYSDRKKRSAPIQSSNAMTATPVETPGRKTKPAAVPRVATLKTPKAKPTARKSMAAGKTASPAVKVRTPHSAPGKVATKLPKSAGKTPVSAKRPVPTITDETPKRRGRPPKAPDSATAARTPVKTPAKVSLKAPATEPARRGRPISAGKRTSPLKKRHSLSARLSAPKVTKADAKSTPKAKGATTPKSGAKAEAVPAEPPKRRGRPPKTAPDSADVAKKASSAKSEETASKPARGRKAKVETEAVKPTRGKAPAPAPKPTRGRAAKGAEPATPAPAAKRPGRSAKAEAKASMAAMTTTAAKKPRAAPKASETVADAPKRRGRPPKATTAAAVAPPASKKRGRSTDAKEDVVEPEPKKQKTTRQTKASSASKPAPEPKPEPVKKNKGGRPPKKTPSTATKREPATQKTQAQDPVKPGRGRPKQTQPAAPEPAEPTRGRGRAGMGDVAPVNEKPAAKAAKNSVASGRVTKSKPAPKGAAATRSLRSRA
ncbi:mucin-5B [Emericellopsis cladophorae]|uniref:Mucin-5B n=1 Tax=Emericellopsis cladophorae TaxID=2686198 RepID=A0A9Q0BC74_9HYPO|nr:mucin-5B [Emericellopsis cladophorae]KAI6779270.1 mucin-5B [Emericellopsis cladophorae]